MTRHTNHVTSTDVALLRSLAQERSVAGASRRLGISRDRAVYRIARLEEAFGGPVVRGVRGGAGHGGTTLTTLGDRIAHGGFDSVELLDARPVTPLVVPNLLRGVYRRSPHPEVRVGRSLHLRVAFPAEDGEKVSMALDPETVIVARGRFASSARNVIPGTIVAVKPGHERLDLTLVVRTPSGRLRVVLTEEPVRQLRLHLGARVYLYVKATALRRVSESASPEAPTTAR
jgi:molybdate transport system regulatory protein